ncbi:unnamed protein product, partial [Coccothraustes coccothraustes]
MSPAFLLSRSLSGNIGSGRHGEVPEDGGSDAGRLRADGRRTRGGNERGCAFNFLLTPERDDQVSWGKLEKRFLGCTQRGTAGAPLLPAPHRLPGKCRGEERLRLRGCERERSETRERHGGAQPTGPPRATGASSPARGDGRMGAGPRSPLGASTASRARLGRTDGPRPARARARAPAPAPTPRTGSARCPPAAPGAREPDV